MFFELNRQVGIVSRYCSKLRSVDVVNDVIGSVFQAAKLNGPFPMLGIKSVVQSLLLADDVRLGHIKTNVVKLSEILALREHLFAIDAKPGFELFFARRRQIRLASFLRQRGQDKLRSHDTADPNRGSKVVSSITQFDVIAEVRDGVSDQSF